MFFWGKRGERVFLSRVIFVVFSCAFHGWIKCAPPQQVTSNPGLQLRPKGEHCGKEVMCP